mgnify:CR=1 FL=1|tara:strand:- start:1034 stop:1336 length:303 start_codon:yes stop_codon:yes gene_type:complete
MHPEIEDFHTPGPGCGHKDMLPLGLYCFARQYFTDSKRYQRGLSLVYQKQGSTVVYGLKASPEKTPHDPSDNERSREWRGFVMQQNKGISALIFWLYSSS